ncbi:MAG: VapE domain-containing protein [Alphaproteobacteria bacterium]
MKVSIYPRITDTKNNKDVFIEEILIGIREGKWQDVCLPVMKETDKQKRTEFKKLVPYFTAAGTFKERNNKGINEPSGLIAIDFDEVDNLEMYINLIKADHYTFAIFKSISHTGFCTLVKIDSNKYAESFDGLANYYFNLLKIPIDPACKDISRPRYVSYDPDCYNNPSSKIFKEYPKKEAKAQVYQRTQINYLHTDDKFNRVLQKINTDITGDYNQWIRIGFAIASQYGDSGLDYFHYVSKYSPSYVSAITDRQYKFCCRGKAGVTISTFYYYCKQAGIEISDKTEDFTAKIAHYAKTGGRNKESAKKVLEMQGIKADDTIIDAVFESDNYRPPIKDGENGDKLNIDDVEMWLNTNYSIKKNSITRFYELDGKPIETEDFNSIYIAAKKQFDKLSRDIFDCIIFSNFTPTYNPIKDYLDTLKWDNEDRIHQLTESINSDTGTFDYRRILLQSWLLGIIETIYLEEANILQLILAGKQNTGKSIFFKKLLPKRLNNYFGLSQLDKGKDDELLMCQKLIILDDEYSGKSKLDAKLIKRLLSAPSFDLREPYGKKNVTLKRIASLCATSNETELLNDSTGNRRNIIFEVIGKFSYDLYNSIDKEQLFAQIVALHKLGYKSELTDAMIELIEQYTGSKHSETSIEAETLFMCFEVPEVASDYDFYTTTEIKNTIESSTVQKININKLGSQLKRLGYKRDKKRGIYGYYIKKKYNRSESNEPIF